MAEFSVPEALSVGGGLIARRPLAVLVWGALPIVVVVPLLLAFAGTLFAIIVQASKAGGDQTAIAASILPEIGGLLLFVFLALILLWVLGAVTTAAAYRAVLRPEQSAFGYLRFGGEELWLMAVSFVMGLVFFGVGLAFAIPQSIVNLAVMNSGVQAQVSAAALFGLLRYGVTIWLWLRLSMALPMTFADGKFHLFESWALTRGHTVQLLVFCILAALILVGIELVAFVLVIGGGFLMAGGALRAAFASPQAFFANPQAVIAALGPVLVLWTLMLVVISGVSTALFRAPFAHIYRRLAAADPAAAFT